MTSAIHQDHPNSAVEPRPVLPDAIRLGRAVRCPNPSCKAPGGLLAAKPRNWPWADRCWNCDIVLR